MTTARQIRPEAGHEITLTRLYDAPRALVFRMWTDPEHMRVWSCPRGFNIPEATGSIAASGGDFRVVMQAPDGQRHVVRGRYLEVRPLDLISFTHQWEEDGGLSPPTTVTVRFEEAGDGRTHLTLHQGLFRNAELRDGHRAGWAESLDKLARHLETIS